MIKESKVSLFADAICFDSLLSNAIQFRIKGPNIFLVESNYVRINTV